jgi:DNA-damage-inducible protein J
MSQSVFSVRIDADLKEQFDTLCDEFGMNATTAITVFAKTVVRERKVPFEITASADPFWGEINQLSEHAKCSATKGFSVMSRRRVGTP